MSLGKAETKCSRVLLRAQDRVGRHIDRVIDLGLEEAPRFSPALMQTKLSDTPLAWIKRCAEAKSAVLCLGPQYPLKT